VRAARTALTGTAILHETSPRRYERTMLLHDTGAAYTDNFGGTSSAAPLAAGIDALVLSVNPSLTRMQVRDILRATAKKIDSPGGDYRDGYSLQYGYGRLNAHEAVRSAQTRAARRRSAGSRG